MRLKETLNQFMDMDGIAAAVVAGTDGLLIDGLANGERDLETLSALGAQAVLSVNRVARLGNFGSVDRITFESDSGFFAVEPVGNYALLIVAFEREINVGYVRFMLKRGRDRLLREIEDSSSQQATSS